MNGVRVDLDQGETMIQSIGVIGAGQMGNGIAQVAACAGYDVVMIDIKDEYVEKGLGTIRFSLGKLVSKERMTQDDADAALARITTGTDRGMCADCDLVVEAVPEILSLKQEIFTELDTLCKPETILASNTSSISITTIAASTQRPDKVIGMHFMNPVPIMKLVEIINGADTSDATNIAVVEAAEKMGKTALSCNDAPGFVSNRILCPMINEAILTLAGRRGRTRSHRRHHETRHEPPHRAVGTFGFDWQRHRLAHHERALRRLRHGEVRPCPTSGSNG